MSDHAKRLPRDLRDPDRHDRETHENRLFEIEKEARFASDPTRTAHSMAQIAMWIDGGSRSNVQLAPAERLTCREQLAGLKRHAFENLPNEFSRSDIMRILQTWAAQLDRWATALAERSRDHSVDNLRDIARVWRNGLHSAVLVQDVNSRLDGAKRRASTINALLHERMHVGVIRQGEL